MTLVGLPLMRFKKKHDVCHAVTG